jgi:hypothetical protein
MRNRFGLRLLLIGTVWLALFAAPALPLPGGDRLGFVGEAHAQQQVNIDDFYDELDPFGQWVWHPRYGYVWLPETVSQDWRPYTVGHWVYTDEYGWYWDSHEPFAWAVYHYGRWGYDDDYGWFWVPGDTWAPAWVQWRYSDDYVGWAPVGPRRNGYAYGVPVNYDPPVAESWVFVQPRYMTSRAISHYAVPVAGLGAAFVGATNVYRPEYRGGVIYNYGIPRDRMIKITRQPIYIEKVFKVDRKDDWKNNNHDNDRDRGIKIFAPGVDKDRKPDRGPKRFADHPNDFKPKAKLKDTFKGDLPKGFGQSAKDMKSIAKEENADAFNKHGRFGPDDEADRSGDKGDQDKGGKGQGGQGGSNQFKQGNRDNDQGGQGKGQGAVQGQGGQGGFNQFKQGNRDDNDKGDNNKNKKNGGNGNANNDAKTTPPPTTPPPIEKVIRDQGNGGQATTGGATQTEQATIRRDGSGNNDNNQTKNKNKNKSFGDQGSQGGSRSNFDQGGGQGQGGSNQFKQGNRDNNDQGGGGGKPKTFGGANGQGGSNQFKQGNRDNNDQGGGDAKPKTFGGANGQSGQGGRQGGGQAQGGGGQGGGGGGGGDNNKCQKHPEKPECQNHN